MIRLINLKLGLVVSLLHGILLVVFIYLGSHPLEYGTPSMRSSQVIELRSITPVNRIANQPFVERAPAKPTGTDHHPLARADGLSKVEQGNPSELTFAQITPPSVDAYKTHNPKPPYPISSRENGEQGAVTLYACITDHGKVDRVALAQSSGFPALDRSALNTVRHWNFRPAQEGGKPIPMCYRLPIRFLLSSATLFAVIV